MIADCHLALTRRLLTCFPHHVFDARKVVRKILRMCIHQPQTQLSGETGVKQRGEGNNQDRRNSANRSNAFPSVPLARLLLRGNDVSDSGALALAPLVKESPHLTAIDLRDNAIGSNGKLALKKVTEISLFRKHEAGSSKWSG